jgi:hypothetical protein
VYEYPIVVSRGAAESYFVPSATSRVGRMSTFYQISKSSVLNFMSLT